MFPFLKYLNFQLKATNEHGVHSPFVFNYLTKCLYQSPRRHPDKVNDIILKSIPYLGIQTVLFSVPDDQFQNLLRSTYPALQFDAGPYDMVYLTAPDDSLLQEYLEKEGVIHNNSLCIINGIHTSQAGELAWELVKGLEGVRVTIDTFYCGLVFFRREQAKQHFKIRI